MPFSPIWDAHVTLGEGTFARLDLPALLAQMDGYGIQGALVAPDDRRLAVENRAGHDALLELTHQHPDRFCGYATVNPWYGRQGLDELTRSLDAGLVAVKLHPARQGFALLDDVARPLWELLAARRVPVYVVTGSALSTPLQLAEIARRYPQIAWIMGRSGRTDYGWLDFARALRQAPNLYVETAHTLPAALGRLLTTLGPTRLLFVSDLPNTHLHLELGNLDDVRVNGAPLDAPTRALLMGGNLARLLGRTQMPGAAAGPSEVAA
jgi:predicted TIM-barrel fold metal-dependent hydrolase